MNKIHIVGAGYVGLAHACLFSKNKEFEVVVTEIDNKKLKKLQNYESTLEEYDIKKHIESKPSNLTFTNKLEIDENSVCIFVAVPTNWNEEKGQLDTSILTDVLNSIETNIPIVIKSTIPMFYTQDYIDKTGKQNIVFSPEFLREGSALADLLFPSRIVIGTEDEGKFNMVKDLYLSVSNGEPYVLKMSPTEAESSKLFANTYLALRVSFFNELDSVAQKYNMSSEKIIKSLSFDSRIGNLYNNPSFGYGGYCLPKDTKQLSELVDSNYSSVISAVIRSNNKRKQFIVDEIIQKGVKIVGVESFAMKSGSDNDRESALFNIVDNLIEKGVVVLQFNPENKKIHNQLIVSISDWDQFCELSELILANRLNDKLEKVRHKVYTRDISHKD